MAIRQEVYEFVDKVSDDLTCSICMKVMCQPHLVNCCEQQFCKSCLEKWSKTNKSCPNCRSTDFVKVLLKQKSRRIGELKVYCPNKKHGCKSTLKISEYDNHLSTNNAKGCQYVLVYCSFHCANQASIRRCHMKKHKESQCPRRPVNCAHCKLEGEHQVITGDHLKTCPSYPLDCPQQCGATVLRKDLKAHKDVCPEELAACPYSELGCKVKVQRKDLEKHVETSAAQHMAVLAQSYLSLKAEHTALKRSYEDINTRLITAGQQLQDIIQNPDVIRQCVIATPVASMCPFLVGTTEIAMGKFLHLQLSQTNMESGHYHFKVSCYMFKLEWQRQKGIVPQYSRFAYGSTDSWGNPLTQLRYLLKLYLLVDDTHPMIAESWSCDVKIENPTHNLAVICKGKPLKVNEDEDETTAGDEVNTDEKEAAAGYMLLGTSKQCYYTKDLIIRFDAHNSSFCQKCRREKYNY